MAVTGSLRTKLLRPTCVRLAIMMVTILLLSGTESFAPPQVTKSIAQGTTSQNKLVVSSKVLAPNRNRNKVVLQLNNDNDNDKNDGININNEKENSDNEEKYDRYRIGSGTPTRRTAVARMLAFSPLVMSSAASASLAATATTQDSDKKQTNLSDEELIKIVVDRDLVQNQFLVNGKLTRSIYDESCTFQDEIDVYGLDQWMTGTAKLFDGDRSRVVLVPGSVKMGSGGESENQNNRRVLEFRFVEYLCFNIPLVKPIVFLSGTLFLEVSERTGLITSYREKWDHDIYKVLTSESKLFTSSIPKESLDASLDAFFKINA